MKIRKNLKKSTVSNFHLKNYLYLLFTPFVLLSPHKSSLASCTTIGFGNAQNTPSPWPYSDGDYAQNGTTNCSGDTTANVIAGNSVYGSNFLLAQRISAQTSQIVRWQHPIRPPNGSGNIEINIAPNATLVGNGTTKGLLLVHSGYYRINGNGTVPDNTYTPENHPKIIITNNGSVRNTTTTPNSDYITSSAASIESNDGPIDQFIINNGSLYSSTSWGALISGLAVNSSNQFLGINEYLYTYGNVVGFINNGSVIQENGIIDSNSRYAGHSAAVAIFVPTAKEVFLTNASGATISGKESGVDILTSDKIKSSYLTNAGKISGKEEAGIAITPGAISNTMRYVPHLNSITNEKKGEISGGKHGILNQGNIDLITNSGKINGIDENGLSITIGTVPSTAQYTPSVDNINNQKTGIISGKKMAFLTKEK